MFNLIIVYIYIIRIINIQFIILIYYIYSFPTIIYIIFYFILKLF